MAMYRYMRANMPTTTGTDKEKLHILMPTAKQRYMKVNSRTANLSDNLFIFFHICMAYNAALQYQKA